MPPKVPNLKFKPRHIVRAKEEPDVSESPTALDNLSFVQLERLRLQQEAALQQEQKEREQQLYPAQQHVANGVSSAPSGALHNAGAATPGGSERLRGFGRVAIAAAAVRALTRDFSNLPPTSEHLPENTMSSVLEMESENPATTVYRPTPLDSNVSAEPKHEAEFSVEGDVKVPVAETGNDGIAFLKGYEKELKSSRQDNLRFDRDVLHASANALDVEADVGRRNVGELVWFQLPRFQADPPFRLSNLPPGKVGEIKVYKSGRMIMEIGGVCYDVAVEGYSAVGTEACNVVSAVTPAQQPTDMARCYQLGLLSKKLVCTPSINVDAH